VYKYTYKFVIVYRVCVCIYVCVCVVFASFTGHECIALLLLWSLGFVCVLCSDCMDSGIMCTKFVHLVQCFTVSKDYACSFHKLCTEYVAIFLHYLLFFDMQKQSLLQNVKIMILHL